MGARNLLHFKSEFRTLRRLTHTNLVSLGELFEHGGGWFFSMELVDGSDFLTWVRPGGSFDEGRLRDGLRQVARGLAVLHGARKIHRDLKPSNVLVTRAGRVVILDFGLAVDLDGDREVVAGGTLSFMAPEQRAGRAEPASDWFSVGVMLHLALTGRLPHRGTPGELEGRGDLGQLCLELLQADPARRPPEMEVLRRLGCEPEPAAPTLRFLGREDELARLTGLVREVTEQNRGVVAMISGDSGVGKTALLKELARSLPEETVTLSGRCHEREAVPYKALDELTDALSRHLAALPDDELAAILPADSSLLGRAFPVLRECSAIARARPGDEAIPPSQQRLRMFAALRELLSRLARRKTLILTIDDLQWTDGDSLALLRTIIDGKDAPRMLLLLVARPSAGQDGESLLSALGPEKARALADHLLTELLPNHDAADCEAILAEAGGSPLFIDLLARQRALQQPVVLEEALWGRMQSLDDHAHLLLKLVCLAGGPITHEVAAAATGIAPDRQAWLAGALCAHRFVSSTGLGRLDVIEPYHDRVRETSMARLTSDLRIDLHQRLALAFESADGADPEQLAVHWRGAGRPKKACQEFVRAAAASEQALAFDRGARLYQQAIDLSDDVSQRRELMIRQGDCLINGRRSYEGAQAFHAAIALAPGSDEIDLRRRASEHLLKSGHLEEALVHLTAVLASVGVTLPRTPAGVLVRLLLRRVLRKLRGYRFTPRQRFSAAELTRLDTIWSVASGLAYLDSMRAVALMNHYLSLAMRAGEPTRVALGLSAEVVSLSIGGRSKTLIDFLLAEAERLAGDESRTLVWIHTVRAVAHYHRGEWRTSLQELLRAEQRWSDLPGASFERNNALFFLLGAQFFLGQLSGMRERLPAIVADAERLNDLYLGSHARLSYCNSLWLAEDAPERARAEADAALAPWPAGNYVAVHYYHLMAQANIDLYLGGCAAWQRLESHWPEVRSSLLMRIPTIRIVAVYQKALAALAATRLGDKRGALFAEARRCARRLRGETQPWATVMADLVQVGLHAANGEREEAISLLRHAIARLDQYEMALYAAAARGLLGDLMGGADGQALVAEAADWMATAGVRDGRRFSRILVAGRA
jgi:serine/threonine protein kinase/tetratricopeptide (TPR) repeat protein